MVLHKVEYRYKNSKISFCMMSTFFGVSGLGRLFCSSELLSFLHILFTATCLYARTSAVLTQMPLSM